MERKFRLNEVVSYTSKSGNARNYRIIAQAWLNIDESTRIPRSQIVSGTLRFWVNDSDLSLPIEKKK
jgi:hypothetical protein